MQTSPSNIAQFQAVDQASDPHFFAHFMDTSHTLQAIHIYRQTMINLLAPQVGASLLDVGCGTGNDAQELARLVGPSGHVIGIDMSEHMIQEATQRARDTVLPLEYRVANATQLPFAANTFDGCQASRTFEHLDRPEQALAEMIRVAKPGAPIVVADADFDLTIVDIPDRALARKLVHLLCDSIHQGWMGRQLPSLFAQAGLNSIIVQGHVLPSDYSFFQMVFNGALQDAQKAGLVSVAEVASFWHALEQAQSEQRFFAGIVGFVVSGHKPVEPRP